MRAKSGRIDLRMDDDDLRKALAENYTRTIREQFALANVEPMMWGDQAFELIYSAEILSLNYQNAQARHDANMFAYYVPVGDMKPIYALRSLRVVYYLYGLAIENFLKGIFVCMDKKPPRSHDLRKLAVSAKVESTDRQATLLDELTAIIVWGGRYHLPWSVDEFAPRPTVREFPSIPGTLGLHELREIVELVSQTAKAFKEKLKAFEPIRAERAAKERMAQTKQGSEKADL
jgi:hypothetical protein